MIYNLLYEYKWLGVLFVIIGLWLLHDTLYYIVLLIICRGSTPFHAMLAPPPFGLWYVGPVAILRVNVKLSRRTDSDRRLTIDLRLCHWHTVVVVVPASDKLIFNFNEAEEA